jgi:hypothetical protein
MDAVVIYRDRPDDRFYDVSTGETRGGPDKVIAYANGFLFTMDRDAKIAIPVSRWKLAEIGLGCVLAALKGKGSAPRSVPLATPPPDALPAPPPEATESPEERWERLMQEMRDLSR